LHLLDLDGDAGRRMTGTGPTMRELRLAGK
jgi:hypothetical protein